MDRHREVTPDICLRLITCPVCGAALGREGAALRCNNGHAFDIAREGYVNLLAGRRLSASVGDTRAMLLARRRFLERGHYARLAQAVSALAGAHLETAPRRGDGPPLVLDAGCGEGWYLASLKAHVERRGRGPLACYIGTDISKEAARLGAQRHRDILFLVADTTRRLPLADGSAKVLLNVFAPRSPVEFARVTGPGGLLVVVIPRPAHLAELRHALPLLGIEADKQRHVLEQLAGAFQPAGHQELDITLCLQPADLPDLVTMTPSSRHLTPEAWEGVHRMGTVQVTASFTLLCFRRS